MRLVTCMASTSRGSGTCHVEAERSGERSGPLNTVYSYLPLHERCSITFQNNPESFYFLPEPSKIVKNHLESPRTIENHPECCTCQVELWRSGDRSGAANVVCSYLPLRDGERIYDQIVYLSQVRIYDQIVYSYLPLHELSMISSANTTNS